MNKNSTATKKHWTEVYLLPLVIAAVGISGSYIIAHQQKQAATYIASKDREVTIVSVFIDHIMSDKEDDRILGLNTLKVLNADLALQLARAVAQQNNNSEAVRLAAEKVVAESISEIDDVPLVYIHVSNNNMEDFYLELQHRLQDSGYLAPGIESVGDKLPRAPQLRYFHENNAKIAANIKKAIDDLGINFEVTYIPGYADRPDVSKNNFELWFGKDTQSNPPNQ